MKVRLLAFATARQALGRDELELEIEDDAGVKDLVELLTDRHPEMAPLWPRLAIAVNGQLVGADAKLADGAEIALLPPVSGGAPEARTRLVEEPIDVPAVSRAAADPSCGAVLIFLGSVRRRNRGRAVDHIVYDAYRPMAAAALERIAEELESGDDHLRVRIVHRLGQVPVGEASVAIAVASPHRESAFSVSRRALERLKREVPIWKLEHYTDGSNEWREEESLGGFLPDLIQR